MKRFAILFVILMSAYSALGAGAPKECTICVGAVADFNAPPATVIPLLLETTINDLATIAQPIDALSPEQRKNTAVVVRYSIEEGKDPLLLDLDHNDWRSLDPRHFLAT